MNTSIVSRLRSGIKGQALTKIVQIVVQLAQVPIFLVLWGDSLYGEWLMLTAIPEYLVLSADLGFSGAAVREMTMLVGNGKREEALAVYQSALALVSLLGLGLLVVVLLACLLPLADMLNLSMLSGRQAGLILVMLTTFVVLSLQTRLLGSGFIAEGNYGLAYSLMAGCRMFEVSMCWLGAWLGTPVTAAAMLLGARVAGLAYYRMRLGRSNRWLRIGLSQASWSIIRSLTLPSLGSLAFPLSQAINIQGLRLIIGIFLDPAMLTVFATHRTLSRMVMQPMQAINPIVIPELGAAFGKADVPLLRSMHRKACGVTLWLLIPLVIVLVPLGGYVMNAWTGGRIAYDPALFGLLLLASVVNTFWYSSFALPFAANRHVRLAREYILLNVGTIGISCLLLLAGAGLLGAAFPLVIVEGVMTILVLPLSMALAKDELRPFLLSLLRPPVADVRKLLRRGAKIETRDGG